jgi:hypothetical protein
MLVQSLYRAPALLHFKGSFEGDEQAASTACDLAIGNAGTGQKESTAMTTSHSAERDKLLCLIEIAMMTMPPENLTMDELRVIETVIRGAVDRASRPTGNVIDLAARRAAGRAKLRRVHA